MTLLELFEMYSRKRLRGRSKHTERLYKHSIATFGKTLGHEATTDDLTDDNLQDHLWRVVESGLSVASANKDYAQISALWRFAHRNRLCQEWPNIRPLPEPERVPLGWLPEELDKLFASIAREEIEVCSAPGSLWWRCLINTLLDTGERIGAIRLVRREHLQAEHLLVPAEFRKGKTRDRLYKLSKTTMDDVRLLIKHHNEPEIFPWDRNINQVYYRYKRILQRAGLPATSKHKLHALRRTVASAVQNQGGNPTEALDHASPRTTRAYLDPRITKQVQTADLVAKWRRDARETKAKELQESHDDNVLL